VHDLRTTLRRLIATLDLMEEIMETKKIRSLRKSLKRQLDSLRSLRDTQVQEKLLRQDPALKGFVKFLQKRDRAEKKVVRKTLLRVRVSKLNDDLPRLGENPVFKNRSAQKRLVAVIRRKFENLRDFSQKVIPTDARTVHATRIQFKKYRYASEALETAHLLRPQTKTNLKKLQDLLGDIQDATVLIKSLLSYLATQRRPPSSAIIFLRGQEDRQKDLIAQFQRQKSQLISAVRPG
jgi:CHAD domain-containing protein